MAPCNEEKREQDVFESLAIDGAGEHTEMVGVSRKKLNQKMPKCSCSVDGMAYRQTGGDTYAR